MEKDVLDMCCGPRMMWFNKADPRVLFSDIRAETHQLPDRELVISPDTIADFRELPFADESFYVVAFDPPHLTRAGEKGWQRLKYGALNKGTWREDLRAGFAEAFRVLKPHGVLIFKWNETHIPVQEILALTTQKPLFGHNSGKRGLTHWFTFKKDGE
jgi:ubiquinone/menaquinone biosynthesis C-methylase UbiE